MAQPAAAAWQTADVFRTEARWPECHAVTAAALDGGAEGERLVAVWYAGTAECRPDVALLSATWTEARGWSEPRVLVDTPGRAEGNPVLGVAPGGDLWLWFATLDGPHWRDARLRWQRSTDGGATWSEPQDMADAAPGWLGRNKPVRHGSHWLLPLYDERSWEGVVLRSADGGWTWEAGSRIVAPQRCIQPTLLPLADGGLAALLRCGSGGGPMWLSRSTDGGRHWSPAQPAGLDNPNSACDALVDDRGQWFVACNDDRERDRGVLALRGSADGGATWPLRLPLVEGPGEYAYPALLPAAGGGLHVLYTHERRAIRHLRLPLPQIPPPAAGGR